MEADFEVKKARISVQEKLVRIEKLNEENKWEICASYPVTEVPGKGLVVPLDMLKTLQALSDEYYSLIWDE